MNIARLLTTWFGVGRIPWAPGTFGSLAALPFACVVQYCFFNTGLMLFSLLVFALGTWACHEYVKETGREDPSEAVIDEVAGQCLLLAALPFSWKSYVVGFILFRLFDILKPFPVRWFDKNIKGGFGIMLDDIAAAAYPIVLLMFFWVTTGKDLTDMLR